MNDYKVYCLTNTITNENYVGVTKQAIYSRFKSGNGYKTCTQFNDAIKKYGWGNFTHKILCETNSKYIAGEMEKYYIEELDTYNNGYNNQTGGFKKFKQIPLTKNQKEKLSFSHKGLHNSPQTEFKKGVITEYNLLKMKPVLCIETGIIYDSINQAENKLRLSHIWDCINGRRKTCGGYHWKLAKEVE